MITVEKVTTAKQRREFINFPLDLYAGNPYFVPPLYSDELNIFKKNNVYSDTCRCVFFNAYDGKKIVGRIQGIIQSASNKKTGENRCRFTRFDTIDSEEVAKALFDALENWAKENGMDIMCGPLGYSDLEREGLLVEGFDQLSTFEEQYNAEYYGGLIEKLGYVKEVDWTESMIRAKDDEGALKKASDFVMARYKLHFGEAKNTNDFLRKYKDGFFDLLDVAYEDIYGTVPFTDSMKKQMISNFKLIIDLRYVAVILDENEKVICLGLCFPSIAKAVQKSKGHLTPAAIAKVLKAIKNPEIIDLGLVAVAPEYKNRGINAIVAAELMRMLREDGIDHAETNLNLEENYDIRNMWKTFDAQMHKRRRSYIKKI